MPNCLPLVGAAWLMMASASALAAQPTPDRNLIRSGTLDMLAPGGKAPRDFELTGDAAPGALEAERGVRFLSGLDANRDGRREGSLATTVGHLTPADGRWFRLRIEALAEDDFAVGEDDLFLQVEFFRGSAGNALDHVKRWIYPQVVADRAALRDPGTNRNLGRATWRAFDLEFRTPFPEVDQLRLVIGFGHGQGKAKLSEFWINSIELAPIAIPADYRPPSGGRISRGRDDVKSLVALGGRWYYDPPTADRRPPAQFDSTNADRLFYLAERLEAPFADNTTAWLRKGFVDRDGKLVKQDRFLPDNVTAAFTPTHLLVHSKGLPNHPTATFPDRWRALDGNPNYIKEQDRTWRIPLEPRENPAHIAMHNGNNDQGALPMGPIGLAVNGVVFFNPFDQDRVDAVWRLDRCCGHPAPSWVYHYHKYPVCVKSPWSDDGTGHSPLIGFAFDGFPIYGPYEAAGQLAKDSKSNPLNEFNIHQGEARGWHYHVTPGEFPHLIGGYWGQVDESLLRRGPPGGRRGGPPGFGPPGMGPPGFGPPAVRP
jgi:hypothetical protein